jgi:tetratricopeptide (TPR) repeat protein
MVGSLPDPCLLLSGSPERTDDEEPPVLPGYSVLGRIDAGGMGVVWRVRELEFQRTLALKVMKSAGDSPAAVRRFLAEARITGCLAHPSIVPVHAKGHLPDGRPYFTMKLVEGQTLAARLRGRPDPAAGQVELVRVFAQVCQGVAYAHACGVIHRDLKPANVMVGSFGEVQVMDWGLARESRNEAPSPPESPPSIPQSEFHIPHYHDTLPGVVLGTVPYMPPEQARGEVELLDRRCDVFSLGAILCEILTGAPPYCAGNYHEVLRQAANGDSADTFGRLDGCGADAELVRLAKACLAPERGDRPADAGAVAAAVAAYEAGVERRLRRAEVERAEAQGQVREERKRLRLARGLAAAVLVGLAGLAVGAAVLGEKNRQLVAAGDWLDAARAEAVEKGGRAARARDRTFEALDAMTSSVTGESLETQPAVTAEQKRFLTAVLGYYQEFAGEQGDDEGTRERVAAAAYRVGLIHYRLGMHEAGRRAFEQARDGRAGLAADFPAAHRHPQALAECHNALGVLLRELGEPSEAEVAIRQALALREPLATDHPAMPQYRRALAGSYNNLALLLDESPARLGEAREAHQKALAIREELAAEFPSRTEYRQDLAGSHNNLGTLLEWLRRWPDAEQAHRKALAIREGLAAEFPTRAEYRQDLADSHFNLGRVLNKPEQRAKAVEACRRALAIREKLADDFPAVPRYRHDLGASYQLLGQLLQGAGGRPDEVREAYRRALDIREKLAADFPCVPGYRQDLAATHINLGTLLRRVRNHAKAEESYSQALAILEQLSAEHPDSTRNRRDLAGTHNNLGRLLGELNKRPEAEAAYRQAVAVWMKLVAEFPSVPECRHGLATSYYNLADLLDGFDTRYKDAEAAYRQARSLCRQLATEFPTVPEYRHDLAACYNNLGMLLRKLGRSPDAKAAYRQALTHFEALVADFPGVPAYRGKLAAGEVNFANLLLHGGEPTEALGWYDRAVDRLKSLAEEDGERTTARHFLRTAYWGRAEALDRLDRPADAIKDWDRAVNLSPAHDKRAVRVARACSLARGGQVERAVAEADDLATSPSLPATQFYNLACVYALAAGRDGANREEHVRRGLELLRRAVDHGFKDAGLLRTDDDLKPLRDHEDFRKLLAGLGTPPTTVPGGRQK